MKEEAKQFRLRLKKGDKVIVLAGKDKGKSGKILRAFPAKSRVIVDGVNVTKKHLKKRSESEPGGIKEIPAPLHISNVALFCGHCGRGVRIGAQVVKDKTKLRICKRCQQTI